MTGTALTIREMLEQKQADIRQLLPAHVDMNRFIKSALLAVARNKDLQKCTPASVFTAIVNAAELGLDFTPTKGLAYLVPYGDQAQFLPGYRGFIDLAKRSGVVTRVEAHLVYEKDKFSLVYGTEPKLTHEPCLNADAGEPVGAYAVAFFADTSPQFEFMKLSELDLIQKRSKAKTGPWTTDKTEMQRKTVVRRLFKYLPCSPEIEKALEADNKATGLIDVDLVDAPTEDGEMTERLDKKLEVKVKAKEPEPVANPTLVFDDILTMVQDISTPEDMQDFKKKLVGYVSRLTPEQHKELVAACKTREAALTK